MVSTQTRCDVHRHPTPTRPYVVFVALLTIGPSLAGLTTQETDYRAAQEAWRAAREARLLDAEGWLTMTALHFLREGDNSFGSSPVNDLVLTEGPENAGVLELRNRRVSVTAAAGQTVTINGTAMTATRLYPPEGDRNMLTIGDLSLWVHPSGERLAIRVSDPHSEIRNSFTGLKWFPVDERYRVRGRFIPHDQPLNVLLPNILGDLEPFVSHGSVALTVNGLDTALLPVVSDGRLWFIFRDLTSGAETYPAARFLYADLPDEDGWTTVDFNQAYNPPCAFNPYTTCPLPPEPNRLTVRIEAGEFDYHE